MYDVPSDESGGGQGTSLLFFYLFNFATRAGPISVGNFNPPCQLSLWEETGVAGENPRLSAER